MHKCGNCPKLYNNFQYFQREIRERYENDAELLFTVAHQVQLNPKRMKMLKKDYLAKRTKEQEEAVELRVSQFSTDRTHALFPSRGITMGPNYAKLHSHQRERFFEHFPALFLLLYATIPFLTSVRSSVNTC